MHPLGKTLFLPCVLACLGATRSGDTFSFLVSPVEEGENLLIDLDYAKSAYPKAYIGLDWSSGEKNYTYLQNYPILDSPDENGIVHLHYSIPKSYLIAGNHYDLLIGLCKEPYRRGMDTGKLLHWAELSGKVLSSPGLMVWDRPTFMEMERRYRYYDSNGLSSAHDAYDLSALPSSDGLDRRVPLNATLTYINPYKTPPESLRAELRVLDHLSDFNGIATNRASFSSIPLFARREYSDGHSHRFGFALTRDYPVSRVTLEAYRSAPKDTPCAMASSLLIPVRLRDDAGTRHYQLVVKGIGSSSDEIIIPFSVTPMSDQFGACSWARYCVVGE